MTQAPSAFDGGILGSRSPLVDQASCRPVQWVYWARDDQSPDTTGNMSDKLSRWGVAFYYLGLDVIKRWRADDRETDEKNIGLGV